ncbi:hypothetical protein Rsub_05831 [Raphidocelis subcapitata]|uniref:Survival of motor neuron-related-splicing factor 30 n=1 Tax=Raphidocelis subcapitata TaxID=307507 RepID=A0A2V0P7C8_9CHLO|nr:hypothetical protein Rsub_05831 [Raphidocelis subcapitata]|eukprot:GBF92995.1 hypothetical protein Rsub_05831 [Raphidocelis subcapitata]
MADDLSAEGVKSYDELKADLESYGEQQRQVEQLLLQDPSNGELSEMYDSLSEVIALTKDLLADAKAQHDAALAAVAAATSGAPAGAGAAADSAPAAAAASTSGAPAAAPAGSLGAAQIATPAGLAAAGGVADQIRRAQQRQALTGQAPSGWAVGAECLAYYATDSQWYPAKVESVTEAGNFVVVYDGYGNTEELVPGSVRPRADEAPQEEVYRGVAAPKRKRVEEQPTVTEIPKWLEIKPEDDERTVVKKKKLLKSYKSKIRFQNMDIQQKEKQGSWQQFLKGKGSKPKSGFITGKKKGSMFSVPEGGKVGVIGSGKAMTDYKKAGRHDFSLDGDGGE